MNLQVPVVVEEIIAVPVKIAFDYILPVDLRTIFKGYRLIPAVSHTSITEGWVRPGLQRIVTFSDGHSSKETLLSVDPHRSFSYKNEDFTSPLIRLLLARFTGSWRFTPDSNESTHISWTYTLIPHNVFTAVIVRVVLRSMFRGMLRQALSTLKQQLEA